MSKPSPRASQAQDLAHGTHPAAAGSSASSSVNPSANPNRRRFLFALGAGGAGAAAVATRSLAGPIAPPVATAGADAAYHSGSWVMASLDEHPQFPSLLKIFRTIAGSTDSGTG